MGQRTSKVLRLPDKAGYALYDLKWVCVLALVVNVAFPRTLLAVTDESRETNTLSVVVYLNGVRIHSANCHAPLPADPIQDLLDALGIQPGRQEAALRNYVEHIHAHMAPTAVQECVPGMLEAYRQDYREKLEKLRALSRKPHQ